MAGQFQAIKERRSLSDMVVDAIFERIVSGDIRPGERLNEVRIAAQMGISRAPVREAIQQLRQKGLVVVVPGRGPSVIELTLAQVSDLYAVRLALEQLAIGSLSKERCEKLAADLAAIMKSQKRNAASRRVAMVVDDDIRFHQAIVEASQNQVLNDVYKTLIAKVRMILAMDKSGFVNLEDVAEGHSDIIEAIKTADLDKAQFLLGEHITESIGVIENHSSFTSKIAICA